VLEQYAGENVVSASLEDSGSFAATVFGGRLELGGGNVDFDILVSEPYGFLRIKAGGEVALQGELPNLAAVVVEGAGSVDLEAVSGVSFINAGTMLALPGEIWLVKLVIGANAGAELQWEYNGEPGTLLMLLGAALTLLAVARRCRKW